MSVDITVPKWDFKNKHVDGNIFQAGRDFISSESILICAGRPEFVDTVDLTAIGVVENASLVQNKQLNQLYEIGSRLAYIVPGRVFTQVGLSRVLFNGPSLLKAITWYTNRYKSDAGDQGNRQMAGSPFDEDGPSQDTEEDGHFYINLYSDFFNRPLGLCLILRDSEDDSYGGAYMENCYIENHQLQIAAAQTVIMENANLRCTNIIPLSAEELGSIGGGGTKPSYP